MEETGIYRVIGKRADGTRRVLLQGATRENAETIRAAFVGNRIFSAVIVESDRGHAIDESDLPPDIPPDPPF